MKNFFKRFGVVFLAVMFLFCSLTVSVFAEEAPPDQTDQTETTAVESSAAEGSAIKVATEEDEDLTMFGYYVPSGWACDAAAGSVEFPTDTLFFLITFDGMYYCTDFAIGYSGDGAAADAIMFTGSESYVDSPVDYVLTPENDFLFLSVGVDVAVPFFDNYGVSLNYLEVFYKPFSFSDGWSVPAEYFDSHSFDNCVFDINLNDVLYRNYNIDLGFTVVDGELLPAENSLVLSPKSGGSADDCIVLTSTDSFTFQIVADDGFPYFDCLYFMMHNGEMIPPPTLMESILDIFLSVGEWISGAVSALIPLFWDSSAGALTFVGVLSVSGLAFSVSMLLISLISKFLRFGG